MLFPYAAGLGIAFSAPPGAVTAQAIRRGIARGFRGVFLVQLGSLIGDAVWAIIALTGLSVLTQNPVVRVVLGLVGAVLLLWLAWGSLKEARKQIDPLKENPEKTAVPSGRSDFITGAALSLANPWAIAFWLGIGSAITGAGVSQPTSTDYIVFFLGFMFGALIWVFFLSFVVAFGRRFITPKFFRVINLSVAIGLTYFAVVLLVSIVNLVRAA